MEQIFDNLISQQKSLNKDALLVTKNNGIMNVTLNRVSKYNSISCDLYISIGEAIDDGSNDDEVKVIVFSGNGKNFCTGNDLTNFMKLPELVPDFMTDQKLRTECSRKMAYRVLNPFILSFINCKKPIIAVVQGLSIGIGFSILGLCDFVYATKDALFYGPFIELAQGPEACSSYVFHKIFGKTKANELLTFGQRLNAVEALENKFVGKIFENREEALKYAVEKAQIMSEYDAVSLKNCKQLIMEDERKILKNVNEKELENLIERWASENLIPALTKVFFAKKNKAKL